MACQLVFQRYELKYLLTQEQKNIVIQAMAPYMQPDSFGHTEIRNLYLDTKDYRLIRRSMEKPVYKEKLRIRSYGRPGSEDSVFVEMKRKYRSVVYKRRVALPEKSALNWVCGNAPCEVQSQISNEIDYFIQYYQSLRPVVYLSCERDAYFSCKQDGFRVTFDNRILCREENLCLSGDSQGQLLLDDGLFLMELKCSGGIPLWMIRALSSAGVHRVSFSKYGTAYQTILFPRLKGGYRHA